MIWYSKTVLLIIVLLSSVIHANNIFVAKYSYQADLKIFYAKYPHQVDSKVYFVDHEYQLE